MEDLNPMTDFIKETEKSINEALVQASVKAALSGELPLGAEVSGTVSVSASPDRGDFSANHALKCAGSCGLSAAELAEILVRNADTGALPLEKISAHPSGFINVTLSDAWYAGVLKALASSGCPDIRTVVKQEPADRPIPERAEDSFDLPSCGADGTGIGRDNMRYVISCARRRAERLLALRGAGEIQTDVPAETAALQPEEKTFIRMLAAASSRTGDCGRGKITAQEAALAESWLAFIRSRKTVTQTADISDLLFFTALSLLNTFDVLEARTPD